MSSAATTARRAAAAAAVGAAAIHFYVAPEHLREWWLYGWFFLALGAAQLALAGLILRSRHVMTLTAGIGGTIAVIATYIVSRTTGLPLTPPGGQSHGHSAADIAAHGHVLGGIGNGIAILPGASDAGSVEPVGLLDLSALAAELVLVVALVTLLPPVARRITTNIMVGLGVLAWGVTAVAALA